MLELLVGFRSTGTYVLTTSFSSARYGSLAVKINKENFRQHFGRYLPTFRDSL